MGISASKIEKKEQYVRICEAFEDADMEHCEFILQSEGIANDVILTIRDHEQRTPLHLVCFKGHEDIFYNLLEEHKQYDVSLDLKDKREDTPLNLVCSHCYDEAIDLDVEDDNNTKELNDNKDINEILEDKKAKVEEKLREFNQRKSDMIIKLLQEGAKIRNSTKKDKNNPLHWCVYYGNYEGGMAIFNEYPLIIFDRNEEDMIPLEILLQKALMKPFKKDAKKLVKDIVDQFATALFDNDTDFLHKNATEEEIERLNQISQLRKEGLKAFNLNSLLKNLKLQSNRNMPPLMDPNFMKKVAQLEEIEEENEDEVLKEGEPQETEEKEDYFSNFFKRKKTNDAKKVPYRETIRDPNESDSDDEASLDEKELDITIMIYDEKQKSFLENKHLEYLHKILMVSIYVKDLEIIKLLMDNFMVSPFVRSINKYTGLHFAAKKGRYKITQFFTEIKYVYYNSKRVFNLTKVINKKGGPEYNTPLHLAVLNGNPKVFDLLIKKQADINVFNYRDFRPLDMSRDPKFREKEIELFNELENKELIAFNDIMNLDNHVPKKITLIREDYTYLIIARDLQPDYSKSLIHQQLEMIKNAWNDKMDIKMMRPMEDEVNGIYRFYFLINFHQEVIDTMADYLNLEILNLKRGYNSQFYTEKKAEFTKFRDYHIHQIILSILNREFDIDHYLKAGIIEQIFPIHEFRTRNNLYRNWKKERKTVFFDVWKITSTPKDLRPFSSLAFYYGCDLSLYISFTILYTSFLSIISIIGLCLYLWIVIKGQKLDNYFTPIFSFLISLWVTFTIEKWKRRENEHAFIWNTLNYRSNELVRKEYEGNYVIDMISKKISISNSMSTETRRWIVS